MFNVATPADFQGYTNVIRSIGSVKLKLKKGVPVIFMPACLQPGEKYAVSLTVSLAGGKDRGLFIRTDKGKELDGTDAGKITMNETGWTVGRYALIYSESDIWCSLNIGWPAKPKTPPELPGQFIDIQYRSGTTKIEVPNLFILGRSRLSQDKFMNADYYYLPEWTSLAKHATAVEIKRECNNDLINFKAEVGELEVKGLPGLTKNCLYDQEIRVINTYYREVLFAGWVNSWKNGGRAEVGKKNPLTESIKAFDAIAKISELKAEKDQTGWPDYKKIGVDVSRFYRWTNPPVIEEDYILKGWKDGINFLDIYVNTVGGGYYAEKTSNVVMVTDEPLEYSTTRSERQSRLMIRLTDTWKGAPSTAISYRAAESAFDYSKIYGYVEVRGVKNEHVGYGYSGMGKKTLKVSSFLDDTHVPGKSVSSLINSYGAALKPLDGAPTSISLTAVKTRQQELMSTLDLLDVAHVQYNGKIYESRTIGIKHLITPKTWRTDIDLKPVKVLEKW